MITLSFDLAIPVLQGKGLTLESARAKLIEAQNKGTAMATVSGVRTIPVTYSGQKFTIGSPR